MTGWSRVGWLLVAVLTLDVRYALELSPEDVRLARALGTLLLMTNAPPHEVAVLAEKVRRRASSADDFHFLARLELSRQRPAGALDLAVIATKRDEGCVDSYEAAAEAALQTGDVERAVRPQEIAVNVASEFDDEMPRMLASLERYRSKLAQTPRMP